VELRAARLIRGAGASGEIEPYHDRVRETVVAHLSPAALTECHLRLATTLEAFLQAGGWAEAEAAAEAAAIHFEGAGEKDKAAHYYAAAAERASAALAFKHAAELCQRALDLSSLMGEPRRLLVVRLADALGNAGRGPEAARAYREAARGAREPEVFDLERKQAYWFASSGHVDEGREALLNMLRRVDVHIPGPLGRLAGIVFAGLRVMLRGTQFRERSESEIPREELDRIDVHWDAMRSFSMIDVPAAIYLTPRCLLLALRAGEIGRIARVLAFHSIGTAAFRMPGPRSQIARQMALCIALSEKTRVRYLGGMYRLAGGLIDCVMGRWRESLRKFEEAERIFSQECAGAAWELATVRIYTLWDLLYAGQYRELCRRAPLWSQDGAERGDLFQAVTIDAGPRAVCELIAGRPDAAMRLMDESLQRWTQRNYNVQLAAAAFVRVWIYLYQGRADAAWESLNREWPLLRTHHYLRLSGVRQWLYSARAQCALALAGAAADSGALLRSAERDARQLEADEAPFAHILGRLVRAGCAARRGDRENAMALLGKAADEFDAADMAMMAAAARRRLGELTGGESGRALVEQSELAMKSEEVRDPARLTAMFANGFVAAD
jgi:tetratricopeptide (TPR) repeat protein